ncbi:flavin reductase family protein [Pelagibius sp. CAU 1746]|uniref:flavin reductase family protein n=1 Tax=Pelagibius sp. CAU 1746 TaxID=3140370 RepID=UPI00325B65F7
MTFNSSAFRQALGSFATGVAVVTARDAAGRNRGITVNSFSSVSLEPPLVLFCLDKAALSFDTFRLADSFAINVLGQHQHELSVRFATAEIDKWDGVDYDIWPGNLPVLRDCLANLACRRETLYEGGDHVIILGRVERLQAAGEHPPLVYFQSGYRSIGPDV